MERRGEITPKSEETENNKRKQRGEKKPRRSDFRNESYSYVLKERRESSRPEV
jgi:hypothetical protein